MTLLDMATISIDRVKAALNGEHYEPIYGNIGKISKEECDEIILGVVRNLIMELKNANDCGRATDETVKHMFGHTPKIMQEFYKLTLRNTLSEEGKNRKEWAHILCDEEYESHEESCADCEVEGE